jgi:hypothetical protein
LFGLLACCVVVIFFGVIFSFPAQISQVGLVSACLFHLLIVVYCCCIFSCVDAIEDNPLKLRILWRHFLFGFVVVLMPLKQPLEVVHLVEALHCLGCWLVVLW